MGKRKEKKEREKEVRDAKLIVFPLYDDMLPNIGHIRVKLE